MTTFTNHSVRSTDGTTIGYRRVGTGRPLVLVHGGLLASQHFVELASLLADDFEVIVPDRRGRGMSGPYSDDGARLVDQEADDIRALCAHVGATDLFGLSSGAIVCLEAVRGFDQVSRLALYEPPLSVNGSAPTAWLDRYERELAAGKTAAALITGMRGLRVDPLMSRIPHAAAPLMDLVLSREKAAPGDLTVQQLVPTWHYDFGIIRETADRLDAYDDIAADVLLLGGDRSPGFLSVALTALDGALPRSRRSTLAGLGHQAAVDKPARVAAVLREFFHGDPSAADR